MLTRTYEVRTYGCRMNVHDSERIAGLLDEAGYAPVADGAQPDVVVFSTCAVRENADLDGPLRAPRNHRSSWAPCPRWRYLSAQASPSTLSPPRTSSPQSADPLQLAGWTDPIRSPRC
jgi:hypothetical protein